MTEDVLNQLIWSLESTLPTLAFIALGIVAVVLEFRRKNNELEKRSAIIQTALEKSNGTVPDELLRALNSPKRSLKMRLLNKLLWGIICSLLGIGIIIAVLIIYDKDYFEDVAALLVFGFAFFAVGAGLLAYYFIARHVLRSEIEKEERMLND